jgi:hypothetical protein
MRTSPATNVGDDKDSERRHRAAIEGFAKAAGYVMTDWFYDAAVRDRGRASQPSRPDRRERVRTIIVESLDRLVGDLAVQLPRASRRRKEEGACVCSK